jgi:hypothetical protein
MADVTTKELVMEIKASDRASGTIHDVVANARREMRSLQEEHRSSLHASLEGLNESIGRKSTLGHLGHLLEGGGAVFGLNLIGREMAEVTSKALEFSKELQEGKIDAQGLAVELGKALPILGGFVSAGQNIREMFFHEREEIERINEAAKEGVEYADAMTEAIKRQTEEQVKHRREIRGFVQELARVGLSGPAAAALGVRQKMANAKEDRDADLKAGLEAADPKLDKVIARAEAYANRLRQNLPVERFELKPGVGVDNPDYSPAKGELDVAEGNLKKLRAKREEGRADFTSEFNAKRKQEAENAEAELAQIQKEAAERREELARTSGKKVATAEAEAREAALRAAGDEYGAQVEQLKAAYAAETEAIASELKESIEKIAKEFDPGEERDKLVAKLREDAQKRQAAAGGKAHEDYLHAGEEHGLQILEQETRLRREAIRDVELQASLGGKSLEFERQRLEILAQTAERQAELKRLAAQAPAEFRQRYQKELDKQDAIRDARLQAQGNNTLESAAKDQLKNLAAGGDRGAANVLAKQEIEERYRSERERLDALTKSPETTAEQRNQAKSLVGGLDKARDKELGRVGLEGFTPTGSAGATMNTIGRFGGHAMAADQAALAKSKGDGATPEAQETVKLLTKIQSEQSQLLSRIIELLRSDRGESIFR